MHPTSRLALALSLSLIASRPALAADSPAVALLKGKGLVKSGLYFVVDEETSAIGKWKSARSVLADYQSASDRKARSDQSTRNAVDLEDRRAELEATLAELDIQINAQGMPQGGNQGLGGGSGMGMGPGGQGRGGFNQGFGSSPLIAQRNMLRTQLARITSMQRSVGNTTSAEEKKEAEAQSRKSQQDAKAALGDVRSAVSSVQKRYQELAADPSVQAAFRALEKEKMGGMKLGPSTEFRNMVKSLEKAERVVLGRSRSDTSSRKKTRTRG
ncbi:hypothetical protein [Aquisphaera insulae]|uniref:hypothetical protein n=1 Tax=Aquisphaera insulae TaxID=2712864 RepID=UPI0013ED6B60|nr:hypothetical protein [Aquisphaera insulae]